MDTYQPPGQAPEIPASSPAYPQGTPAQQTTFSSPAVAGDSPLTTPANSYAPQQPPVVAARARNPKKICGTIGIALFALALLFFGGAHGLQYLIDEFAPQWMSYPIMIWLINDVPLYVLGLPVFLLILRLIPEYGKPQGARMKITFLRFLGLLIFCFGASYVISFITNFFVLFVPVFREISRYLNELARSFLPVAALGMSSGGILMDFIFMVVVPAFGEEFIFRYMLRRKLYGAGDKIFIVVSAVAFGLFHMNISQTPFTMLVGATLAWVYAQTNNIWLPIALHFAFNFNSAIIVQHGVLNMSDLGMVVTVLLILAMIPVAIILFAINLKKVRYSFEPPQESSWPYKPPKPPKRRRTYYAPAYAAPGPAYANQYIYAQPYPYPQQSYPAYGQMPYPPQGAPYGQPAPYYTQNYPGYSQPAYNPYTYANAGQSAYTPYSQPAYTPYGQPQYPAAQAPMRYTQPQPAPTQPSLPNPQTPGLFKTCFVNMGMMLFMAFTIGVIVYNFVQMLL